MVMEAKLFEKHRDFLKDTVRRSVDFSQTDQMKGIPPPPIEKPFRPDARRISLIADHELESFGRMDLISAIQNRRSRRDFLPEPLTLGELSFLLWATQGIKGRLDGSTAFRTVPSAGCRHTFETYLCVFRVEGLEVGVYRYLPLEHQLLFEFSEEKLAERISEATFGQSFAAAGAVTFVWTTIPYRMEWRYGIAAHRVIALDAGHVCQNLYLACESIRAGTCAIAAYNQTLMDELLGVDGKEEFTIYLAPVGKV
jgi:SagB-type dehydrogenase family enzyme